MRFFPFSCEMKHPDKHAFSPRFERNRTDFSLIILLFFCFTGLKNRGYDAKVEKKININNLKSGFREPPECGGNFLFSVAVWVSL